MRTLRREGPSVRCPERRRCGGRVWGAPSVTRDAPGDARTVEAQRLRSGIKVLRTSGYVVNRDEGQVIGRGELPMLNKPYHRDELARSLWLVLGGEGRWPPAGCSSAARITRRAATSQRPERRGAAHVRVSRRLGR